MRLTEAQIRKIVNEALDLDLDLDPVPYEPQYKPGEEERLKPFIARMMEFVEEETENCPEVKIFRDYEELGHADLATTVRAVECIPRSSPKYIAIMRILERVWERWNAEGAETTPFPAFDEMLEIEGPWKLKIHPDVTVVSDKRVYITNTGWVTREAAMLIRLPKLWKSLRIPKTEGRP